MTGNLAHYSNMARFSVAPMMDWTDRHCRFLHRQLTKRALLYTEMSVAEAIIRGDPDRLLAYDDCEHPVALQIGGSEPERVAIAARLAAPYGYDEINLNIGCPSDRVQSGAFGACLMREPQLVGECIAAIKAEVSIPVTVKCRIGVDDQDPGPSLDELAHAVWEAGADALWVHARKAWLKGLSPKENRDIPPLDYDRVRRLKSENPNRFIGLNGGLADPIQAFDEMSQGELPLDGAMVGRAAYYQPGLLTQVDAMFYGEPAMEPDWAAIVDVMSEHAAHHIASGGRLIHVTRHMFGLFHGLPGARQWRHMLSTEAVSNNDDVGLIGRAFAGVRLDGARHAA